MKPPRQGCRRPAPCPPRAVKARRAGSCGVKMSQVRVTAKQEVRRWDKGGADSEFPHLPRADHGGRPGAAGTPPFTWSQHGEEAAEAPQSFRAPGARAHSRELRPTAPTQCCISWWGPGGTPASSLGSWAASPSLPGEPGQSVFELNWRDFPLISGLLITFFFFFLN